MALDDPSQKMSKSDMDVRPGSGILLVDPPEVIVKKVRAAVTDSGREVRAAPDKPALSNLLSIFSVIEGVDVASLEERYAAAGYGEFKAALADALAAALAPIRDRYTELIADPGEVVRLLDPGAQRAAALAEETMTAVRARIGLAAAP